MSFSQVAFSFLKQILLQMQANQFSLTRQRVLSSIQTGAWRTITRLGRKEHLCGIFGSLTSFLRSVLFPKGPGPKESYHSSALSSVLYMEILMQFMEKLNDFMHTVIFRRMKLSATLQMSKCGSFSVSYKIGNINTGIL